MPYSVHMGSKTEKKTLPRHFIVDIKIDLFCRFIHRLELSLFILSILLPVGFLSVCVSLRFPPPSLLLLFTLSPIFFSSALVFSLSFSPDTEQARELLFFAGICQKKHDVMESFIYVGVQMYVYSNLH